MISSLSRNTAVTPKSRQYLSPLNEDFSPITPEILEIFVTNRATMSYNVNDNIIFKVYLDREELKTLNVGEQITVVGWCCVSAPGAGHVVVPCFTAAAAGRQREGQSRRKHERK